MKSKFNEFQIGEYQKQDFRKVSEIFREVYVQTYPHFDKRFHKSNRFREILAESTLLDSQVWVAKHHGEIVGFMALAENHIDQLYILQKFQNNGLGGFWINQAKLIYPSFLELYTFECNKKAIKFYVSLGFTTIEKDIAPDEQMPDVKLRWGLKLSTNET